MPTEQERIKELEKQNAYLQSKVDSMEGGDMSLYYAVQRKMKELSKILNKYKLDEVEIEDVKNKTFDRLSGILEKCEKYALSANALGARLGVDTPQATTSTSPIIRSITTPESISNVLGNSAGQNH